MITLEKTDRLGNGIGDGTYHVEYDVVNFENESIVSSVSKSETTETVYVTYRNIENGKSITVRFSMHENNAVRFGDQLNGSFATNNEIMYHLGLKTRTFVPITRKTIWTQQVAKKRLAEYSETNLSISEMYELKAGADISMHTGKLAKGSNYLILGSTVEEIEETKMDAFGNSVRIGKYIYN